MTAVPFMSNSSVDIATIFSLRIWFSVCRLRIWFSVWLADIVTVTVFDFTICKTLLLDRHDHNYCLMYCMLTTIRYMDSNNYFTHNHYTIIIVIV